MDKGWENQLLDQINAYQSYYSSYVRFDISSLYLKNMVTGSLTDITGQLPVTNIKYNTDNITCTCTNFLIEVN